LYALSRVPVPLQKTLLTRIQRDNLTAVDIERIAERETKRQAGIDARGAHVFKRAFTTSKARVVFAFRSDTLSDGDVLDAMHEIKRQLARDNPHA
jgi:hypothetical protein